MHHSPRILLLTFFIATFAFAIPGAHGDSNKFKDYEPVAMTHEACCRDFIPAPVNAFIGCRVTSRSCKRDEPIWARGSIVCSPVSKDCLERRCCQFRTKFYHQAREFSEKYDLLLTPQMPVGAWSVEQGPAEIDGIPTPSIFDRLRTIDTKSSRARMKTKTSRP